MPQLYTQICFYFPVSNASAYSAIINTLQNCLEQLSASFPWLTGQVVQEGSSEGNTGLFKIIPLEKAPHIVVKDLTFELVHPVGHFLPLANGENVLPDGPEPSISTVGALRQANFPISMLDKSIIAPQNAISSVIS
jgi:hypothetical protein